MSLFFQISNGFGEALREFGKAVYGMQAEDEPNYALLQVTTITIITTITTIMTYNCYCFQDLMRDFANASSMSDPYDWENDYIDVRQEEEINRILKLVF